MTEQFIAEICAFLTEELDEKLAVEAEPVAKNNGVELWGLAIRREAEPCTPMIYLEEFFQEYEQGASIEAVGVRILESYERARYVQQENFPDILSLEDMRQKIVFRLVNYQRNAQQLKEQPHVRFLDLAITFQCLVQKDQKDLGTIRIGRELMEYWKLTKEELYLEAQKNTPKLLPVSIRPLSEVIWQMVQECTEETATEERKNGGKEQETKFLQNEQEIVDNKAKAVYIMSNQSGVHGAAALLYEQELQSLAKAQECDFFVLPSSIHEVLLMPYRESVDSKELCSMVREINQAYVSAEDVLSDQVYLYRRDTGAFEYIAKNQEQQGFSC